jgi:hypothetical protein
LPLLLLKLQPCVSFAALFKQLFFFSFLFLVETFVLKLLEKLIRRLALETGRRRRRRSRRKRKRRRS